MCVRKVLLDSGFRYKGEVEWYKGDPQQCKRGHFKRDDMQSKAVLSVVLLHDSKKGIL